MERLIADLEVGAEMAAAKGKKARPKKCPGGKKKRKPKTTPRTKTMSPLESVYSTSGMRRKGRRSLA